MKICTITCHDVYNHGASLQAYALMRYLSNCGHNVEIINYKPDYLSNHYNLVSINNPKWEKNFLTKSIYLLLKVPIRVPGLKRKKAFDKFTLQYLILSQRRYKSNEELKEDPPIADAYICGSDQIWNMLYENGKDPAFYLDFVHDEKIKVSYAASFATDSIPNEYKPIIKKRVLRLNGVGVREKSGVEILKDLNINHALNVVDPVFLLEKKDWDIMCIKEFREKFILVYDFEDNSLIRQIAMDIKKEKGYKIYSVNSGKYKYADKYFIYDGPEVFVSLVKNAQFIIANSFHAAVFSIIFEKNFAIVNRNESINTRMRDLLIDLNLLERLVNEDYKIEDLLKNINYKECKNFLQEKIEFSKNFLKEILLLNNVGMEHDQEEDSICN